MTTFTATNQNPTFLGGIYQAGSGLYDQRTRSALFTGSRRRQSFSGSGQNWGVRLVLKDISEDQDLLRNIQTHQQMNGLGGNFLLPIPQDPNISMKIPNNAALKVSVKASEGQNVIMVQNKSNTVPVTLYNQWYITFDDANHHKVYSITTMTKPVIAGTTTTYRIEVDPELVMEVAADTNIEMWGSIRSNHDRILTIADTAFERRNVKLITLDCQESY